jgi:hypothetical protein
LAPEAWAIHSRLALKLDHFLLQRGFEVRTFLHHHLEYLALLHCRPEVVRAAPGFLGLGLHRAL